MRESVRYIQKERKLTRQCNELYQMTVNRQTTIKFVRHINQQLTCFLSTLFDRIRVRSYSIENRNDKGEEEEEKKPKMNTTKL